MGNGSAIVWFRQDLRVEDNAALGEAADSGAPVVPLFIDAAEEEGDWPLGSASRWWLHHSLAELSVSLRSLGSPLVLRRGAALQALIDVATHTGATAVYVNRRYEPAVVERDQRVAEALAERDIALHTFEDSVLFSPDDVRNRSGEPYRVFTPFWKRLLDLEDPGVHRPSPRRLPPPKDAPDSLTLDALALLGDVSPDGDWQPGETGGLEALDAFLEDVHARYEESRNDPRRRGTSRLSPHLHFGEVSPRRVWLEVRHATRTDAGVADPFLRQLAWREFGQHLVHHYPRSPIEPLRPAFGTFPWRTDAKALRAWQEGRTGYPFVDAGMRELATTGWMHNRVRMVAASFLVKHLLLPWQEGARWYWERLVDADLGNNTMGWQWVSGCGADAAPFFRIFNPVNQGRTFDPDGTYVRSWVPELAALPDAHLHAPWACKPMDLAQAGVTLGEDYPEPIVEHGSARVRALDAYDELDSGRMAIT